jgi:hypothetical protein
MQNFYTIFFYVTQSMQLLQSLTMLETKSIVWLWWSVSVWGDTSPPPPNLTAVDPEASAPVLPLLAHTRNRCEAQVIPSGLWQEGSELSSRFNAFL